jgi:hypothetical protein
VDGFFVVGIIKKRGRPDKSEQPRAILCKDNLTIY